MVRNKYLTGLLLVSTARKVIERIIATISKVCSYAKDPDTSGQLLNINPQKLDSSSH